MGIIIFIALVVFGIRAFKKYVNNAEQLKNNLSSQATRCRGIALNISGLIEKEKTYKNKIKMKEQSIRSCGERVFDSIDNYVCYNDADGTLDNLLLVLEGIETNPQKLTSFAKIQKASNDLYYVENSLKQISSGISANIDYLKKKDSDTTFLLQAAKIQKKEEELNFVSGDDTVASGAEYERYCARWLRNNGYNSVNVTQESGDFGADIICHKDGEKIVVQCKRWANPVGAVEIQKLLGAQKFYDADKCIFMTTGKYTSQAVQMAMKCNVELKTVKMQGDY